MPSSIAARVAEMASSRRCFFSLSSTSVAAPTLMTQTPPASLASRSCSFSRSQSESVFSISAPDLRGRGPRPRTITGAVDDRGVVLGDDDAARGAEHLQADLVELEADLRGDDLAPVRMARSPSIALRRSPKPGALTATDVEVPRILLTTRVDSASPSTSSAMISSGLLAWTTFSSSGSSSGDRGDLALVDEDVRVLEDRLHALRVGDEVRRDVALVELHALGELQLEADGRATPRR